VRADEISGNLLYEVCDEFSTKMSNEIDFLSGETKGLTFKPEFIPDRPTTLNAFENPLDAVVDTLNQGKAEGALKVARELSAPDTWRRTCETEPPLPEATIHPSSRAATACCMSSIATITTIAMGLPTRLSNMLASMRHGSSGNRF